jgi:hypothetical protein
VCYITNVVDYACVTISVINQVCIPTSVVDPMHVTTSAINQVCVTTNVLEHVHITTSATMLVHFVASTSFTDEWTYGINGWAILVFLGVFGEIAVICTSQTAIIMYWCAPMGSSWSEWGVMLLSQLWYFHGEVDGLILYEWYSQGYDCIHSCCVHSGFAGTHSIVTFKVLWQCFLCYLIDMCFLCRC